MYGVEPISPVIKYSWIYENRAMAHSNTYELANYFTENTLFISHCMAKNPAGENLQARCIILPNNNL
jgi:hypothetical protein